MNKVGVFKVLKIDVFETDLRLVLVTWSKLGVS